MKWIEILKSKDGNYAVLQDEKDTQFVLASGYNPDAPEDQKWGHGSYFMYWNKKENKAEMLMSALDLFRYRTEKNYIPRSRLEDLATKFKDGLYSYTFVDEGDDYFFDEECEMTDYEKEFFGIGDADSVNGWKDPKDELPNAYEEVEVLADDNYVYRDMSIRNEFDQLEWKYFSNDDIEAWRKIQ